MPTTFPPTPSRQPSTAATTETTPPYTDTSAAASNALTASSTSTPTTTALTRLVAMSTHLTPQQPAKKPPITCHILDTTTGRPAASVPVSLTLLSPLGPSAPLTSVTNADGRITAWSGPEGPENAERTLEELFNMEGQQGEEAEMVWAIKLDVKEFWRKRGTKAFFEEVEVRFVVRGGDVRRGERFHVPVLLGPFSYSTYRGS